MCRKRRGDAGRRARRPWSHESPRLPLIFPLEWVGIAVVVGVLVGVVAGLYPAWNGARIDPIEALRYE